MDLQFYKKIESKNNENNDIFVWKFIDENGNIWRTETSTNESELDAKQIILDANQ